MSTDILDIEINKYLPLLGSNEKKTLITVIQSFLSLQGGLQGISIPESYNREIDDAMERIYKKYMLPIKMWNKK